MTYQGEFPHSSQGIGATANLDDERILRALEIEYFGETGRATAVFRFQSKDSYSVAFETLTYENSLYEAPSPTVRASKEVCMLVVEGSLDSTSPSKDTELLRNLEEDLDLVLSEYLPCEIRFASAAPSPARFTSAVAPLQTADVNLRIAEGCQHLAAGHLDAALAAFQEADAVELPEVPNYRALPYIAEVRCRSGDAEEGLALLDDVACMVRVDRGELPCFVGPPTSGAPGSGNPGLTDACWERMCGELYLPYYEDRSPGRLQELDELEAEVARVRDLCLTTDRNSEPREARTPR